MKELDRILLDILREDDLFLAGVHRSSEDFMQFIQGLTEWGSVSKRTLKECFASLEPCIRQSIVMSLIPAKAFDHNFNGSIDAAIDEHVANLGISLSSDQKARIRDICINVMAYKGLSAKEARDRTKGISYVRSRPLLLKRLSDRQNGRCLWCGVGLDNPHIELSLEHVAPKHIGGDHYSESNWALVCTSCNLGKKDTFAWPANSEAHDFLSRTDFADPFRLGLPQRWSVLMRDKSCSYCGVNSSKDELLVYRRLTTGLPTPSNCGVACRQCIATNALDLLDVRWSPQETSRTTP